MSGADGLFYIVTGASAGIGRAVATLLASRGSGVIAVARSWERLQSLAVQFPDRIAAVRADLSEDGGIEKVVAAMPNSGTVAGIVHSAGSLVPLQPYGRVNADELAAHFRIHVGAPIALANAIAERHAIKRMLFIDSYSASNAREGWAGYSIVKAAAQMSARCAAQELTGTVTIRVYPGAVKTQIVDAVLASETETAKTFAAMIERGECIEPQQAAKFIVGLIADAQDELLRSREAWDYNSAADRDAVMSSRKTR